MNLRRIAVPFGPYLKGDQVQLGPEDEKRLGAHLEPLAPAPAESQPAEAPAAAAEPETPAVREEEQPLPPKDKKAPRGRKK